MRLASSRAIKPPMNELMAASFSSSDWLLFCRWSNSMRLDAARLTCSNPRTITALVMVVIFPENDP